MQDKYYELTITLNDTFVDVIADYILNIYDEGVELGDGQIIVRSESDLTFVKDALVSLSGNLDNPIEMKYKLEEKENVDWIKTYQDSIQPIEAGRFYIFPSWYEPNSNYIEADNKVVDVGCGSGILGLACKKLGANVELCDTDPLSVESCKENFELNEERYDKLWEGSIDKAEGSYDVVIANIIADVLRFIAKDLKAACREDGLLILSGILDKKEELVKESFKDLKLEKRTLKDEWVTLVYKKEARG
jgi:ribosomal protein L11 methyltransferase